jgi:DNA-directed RNA polymerase specialized sigma24 family protein
VLSAIGASFDWLCTRPHPVGVDGRAIPGLPDALIPLDELRSRVIARGWPLPVSDAVWAHLASRSRTDGASWTVACAGMALPMLRRVVRTLTLRFAGDRADIAAETVAGFLAALAVIDVGGVALFASLRWAAYRAGLAAVHAALAAPIPLQHESLTTATATPVGDVDDEAETGGCERAGGWRGSFGSGPPPAVAGHPDLVLARAVADGILSLAEAALIGSTRLEALTIADAAKARGQSIGAVTVARHRAEHRLRRYLTTTPPNPPEPAPTARVAVAGTGSVRPEPNPRAGEDSSGGAVTPSGRRRIRTRASRPNGRGSETTR